MTTRDGLEPFLNRQGRPGADYYYALRRVVGARRSGMSSEYVAAVCAEALRMKEEYGPWPSRS